MKRTGHIISRVQANRCWSVMIFDGLRASISKDEVSQRPNDLWRWRELLPVRRVADIVSLGETILRSFRSLGPQRLREEGRFSSRTKAACRPDRSRPAGSRWRCRWRRNFGVEHLAMPTNGNAGAALAAYARRAGMRATVFCPEDTPEINRRARSHSGRRTSTASTA